MARQIFDDGSFLDFDAFGSIIGGADVTGAAIAPPSNNMAQQVFDLLSLGVKSAIYSKYGPAAQQAALPASQQGNAMAGLSRALPGILILGAGALLIYKLAK